jgi:hypothetical protein
MFPSVFNVPQTHGTVVTCAREHLAIQAHRERVNRGRVASHSSRVFPVTGVDEPDARRVRIVDSDERFAVGGECDRSHCVSVVGQTPNQSRTIGRPHPYHTVVPTACEGVVGIRKRKAEDAAIVRIDWAAEFANRVVESLNPSRTARNCNIQKYRMTGRQRPEAYLAVGTTATQRLPIVGECDTL